MSEVRLSEQMIDSMRSRIGISLWTDDCRNNEEATRYEVLRFAEGIGDTNPLWSEPSYATSAPYGEVIAPPTWPHCCFSGAQFGWPGLGAFHASSDLTFHLPVRLGERITPECIYQGFDGPKPSSFAGQSVTDHFRQTYHDQHGELAMELHKTVIHYERGEAKSRASVRVVEEQRWTEDQLAEI
jgi:acyl dehydratase